MKHNNHDLQASYELLQLLENSKSSTETVLDQLSQLFFVIDDQGNVWRANQAAANYLGTDLEDCLGLKINSRFTPENWQIIFNSSQQLRKNNFSGKVELELTLLDSQKKENLFHWHISRLSRTQESVVLYCLVGENISQLQTFLNYVPVVLFSLDTEGIFTFISGLGLKNFADQTNYIGKHFTHFLPDQSQFQKALKSCLSQPQEANLSITVRDQYFELYLRPQKDILSAKKQVKL